MYRVDFVSVGGEFLREWEGRIFGVDEENCKKMGAKCLVCRKKDVILRYQNDIIAKSERFIKYK